MSNFIGILTPAIRQLHIDMITEVLRATSVDCQLIFGDTLYTDCPNCIFDSLKGKSANKYQAGGPILFSMGICPYCHGLGRVATNHTETIKLAPIYDYKHWIPGLANGNIESPFGFVQTVSLFETRNALAKTKEVIIDTSITDYVTSRFVRHSEPQPIGFGGSDFIITMWRRINA